MEPQNTRSQGVSTKTKSEIPNKDLLRRKKVRTVSYETRKQFEKKNLFPRAVPCRFRLSLELTPLMTLSPRAKSGAMYRNGMIAKQEGGNKNCETRIH